MADPLNIVAIAASANLRKRNWGSSGVTDAGLEFVPVEFGLFELWGNNAGIRKVFSRSYPPSQKRVEFTYDDR